MKRPYKRPEVEIVAAIGTENFLEQFSYPDADAKRNSFVDDDFDSYQDDDDSNPTGGASYDPWSAWDD